MSLKGKIFLEIEKRAKRDVNIGFTAFDFIETFNVKRNVISHHLNRLVEDGVLIKTEGRPVKFFLADKKGAKGQSVFSKFIGSNGSLKDLIESCKAAISYPPEGLSIIGGESGVGKSFLAKLIHSYSVENHYIRSDAPFLTLNCADYANNPELLSAMLFGYKKGAFTGAYKDEDGILKKADGGYLFLDEIHRLSNENQEKLFLFLDQQRFSRLGENGVYQNAKLRMIFATTENIDSSLLMTFRRRIPLKITISSFRERPLKEKIELIYLFFQREAKELGCRIRIHPVVLDDLVFNTIKENIGGLENKVKLLCALAYDKQEVCGKTLEITSSKTILGREASKKKFFGNIHFFFEIDPADSNKDIVSDLFDQPASVQKPSGDNLDGIENSYLEYMNNLERLFSLKDKLDYYEEMVIKKIKYHLKEYAKSYGIFFSVEEENYFYFVYLSQKYFHQDKHSKEILLQVRKKYP